MAIEKRHIEKLKELRQFFLQNGHCYVPINKEYADLYEWTGWIKQSRLQLSEALVATLESMGFDWVMYNSDDLRWQSRYYELRLFKDQYGHCRIPSKYKENPPLGTWVTRQRKWENEMPLYKKKLLDEIGFSWRADLAQMKEERWMKQYTALKIFKEKSGHCRVPGDWKENRSLGKWVARRREQEDKIPADKKRLLNEIGFVWKADMAIHKANIWWEYFDRVVAHKQKYGHCRVTRNTASVALAVWVTRQRREKAKLSKEKIERLDEIDFVWRDALEQEAEDKWYRMYGELKDFKAQNGHGRVSEKSKTHRQLGNWVARLRKFPERIETDKMELLNKIGFAWSEDIETDRQATWMNYYNRLKSFYEEHGHCRVPVKNALDSTFAHWVRSQYLLQDKLSPERRALLEELDFHWNGRLKKRFRLSFNQKYKLLQVYHKKNGHIHIAAKDENPENQRLRSWFANLRKIKHKLSTSQINRLEKLGFKWSEEFQAAQQEYWMKFYRNLVAHKRKYGHIEVSATTSGEALMGWMRYQRTVQFTMAEWKLNLLNDIGFEWDVNKIKKKRATKRQEQWIANYNKLHDFYEQFRHANVPYNWEDKPMRSWVEKQRYLRDKLSPNQLNLLEQLDFSWRQKIFKNTTSKRQTDELKWDAKYQLLVAYHQEHGNCNVKTSQSNRVLFNWVCVQKKFYKQEKLLAHRKERLESLNFSWDGNKGRFDRFEQKWIKNYQQLAKFKEKYGHLEVPNTKAFQALKKWLALQKKEYNTNHLKPHRRKLLTQLGIKIISLEQQWMENYKELENFIQTNGHNYIKENINKPLYRWVHRQRGLFRKNKLLAERQQLLEAINFNF